MGSREDFFLSAEFRIKIALSAYREVREHEDVAKRIADLSEFRFVNSKFDVDDMFSETLKFIEEAVDGEKLSGKDRSLSNEYIKKALTEWHQVRRMIRTDYHPIARYGSIYLVHNALVFMLPYAIATMALLNHNLNFL